jgi:hypothetical protein
MEVAAEAVQTGKKKRSQSEKVGHLKYIIQLENEQNSRLDRIECILRILEKGLGCFLKFEQSYLQEVICRDEVDVAIVDVLLGAGSEGMLPKDIAARLAEYKVSRWHVSRRLVRMNKRLKKEIDQNVAEKNGWKWATTIFMNENWGVTRQEIELETSFK